MADNHKINSHLICFKKLISDQTGARTQDPRLKRALLYQLSYLVIASLSDCKYSSPFYLKKKQNRNI